MYQLILTRTAEKNLDRLQGDLWQRIMSAVNNPRVELGGLLRQARLIRTSATILRDDGATFVVNEIGTSGYSTSPDPCGSSLNIAEGRRSAAGNQQ